MRVFSIANLVLWAVLFGAWLPYVGRTGLGDPASADVLVILGVTAGLMVFLAIYRLSGRRHILG